MTEQLKNYQKKKVEVYPNTVSSIQTVSVCIQTYRHKEFIAECIDGILMQKTNFPFEILIGEDDSLDGTREICLKYAQKYPDKIRLFLHSRDNVIKINGKPTGRFNFLWNITSANGKYIAMCEGDDYWIDCYKLQKQFEALEENLQSDMCFHSTMRLDNKTRTQVIEANHFSQNTIVRVEEIIEGGGHYCPTASLFFRKSLFNEINPIFYSANVGDYFIQVLGAVRGGAVYLNECMSVYRTNIGTAWRDSVVEFDAKEQNNLVFNKSLDAFNTILDNKYYNSFQNLKAKNYAYLALIYLRNKNFEKFVFYIESSIKNSKDSYLLTKILYVFRRFPRMLYFVISLKRRILS